MGDSLIVMRVTLSIPAPGTPDNTIHRPNADVMLGNRLQHWANIIPTKTLQALITIFIFSEHFKDESTQPRDIKRYIRHVHKDWCTEMSTVFHTQHPSFP